MKKKSNKPETNVQRIRKLFETLKDDWIWIGSVLPSYSEPRNYLAYQIKHSHAEIALRRRRQEYQQLQYLKRQKWVKVKKTEKGLLIALTDKGKMEQLKRSAINRPKLSTGQVCLVLFDIPESAKKGRDRFRFFLKQFGFSLVQKSVWQSEFDLAEDVVKFIEEMKIEKWIVVYVARRKS